VRQLQPAQPVGGVLDPPQVCRRLTWLAMLIGAVAAVAAGIGLCWSGAAGPSIVTTAWGQVVETYGPGLYSRDTPFAGAGARGADAVTLALGLPLLATATALYRRGSLRGALLLAGALVSMLYVYGSLALGTVAYNALFPAYVAVASASLFALWLVVRSIDLAAVPSGRWHALPRRGLAAVMFASGAVLLAVWFGLGLLPAMLRGGPPDRMDLYTTPVTYALDLGIIMPLVFLAGLLVLRRSPLGYLLACPLLILEATLAPLIAAQTVAQVSAGVVLTPAQIVGPVGGFVILAGCAIWAVVALLRGLAPATPAPVSAPERAVRAAVSP
jgi:hypothetical protein